MNRLIVKKTAEEKKIFNFLTQNVIGQEKTMEDISVALNVIYSRLNYRPFQYKNRPIYTVLLTGPSGVGKTFTAEMLGRFFRLKDIIKVNCGEFQDDGSTSSGGGALAKLIGAPKGFIGYFDPKAKDQNSHYSPPLFYNIYRYDGAIDDKEEAAIGRAKNEISELDLEIIKYAQGLSEIINFNSNPNPRDLKVMASMMVGFFRKRRKLESQMSSGSPKDNLPENVNNALKLVGANQDESLDSAPLQRVRAIILIDEIEKASEPLYKLLLSILEKGEITLSYGETVSFKDTIIIITSNLGGEEIIDIQKGKIKMGFGPGSVKNKDKGTQIYKTARSILEKHFKQEFLNRINWIGVFRALSEESLEKIFDLNIKNFQDYLNTVFPITISVSDEVKKFIISQIDREQEGARLINRKIEHYIYQPLMKLEIDGKIKLKSTIFVEMADEEIVFSQGKIDQVNVLV